MTASTGRPDRATHTSSAHTRSADGRVDGDSPGVLDLVGRLSDQLTTLLRQELELAKTEAKQEARTAARAGAGFGMAGLTGPTTDRERRLAEDAADNLDLQRVRDEVEQVVDDIRDPVQARAEEGIEQVRSTARSEAVGLRDEADTSRRRVTDDATGATDGNPDQPGQQVGDG